MAELGAWFLLALCHTLITSAGSALKVIPSSPQRAELGANVTIPCKFQVDRPSINRQYLAIVWEFQGSAIVKYDNKGLENQKKKYIIAEKIAEGAADLHIDDASVSDIGTYRCTVIYSPNSDHKEVGLTVYARPSISAFEKMNADNDQDKILCSVTGFFPEQITVELVKDGKVVSGSIRSSPHRNENGTFSVNSTAMLPSTEKPRSLLCRVHHDSLPAPLQQDIRLVYNEDGGNNTGLIVGVVAGVVVIVLLVIAIFLCKKKSGNSEVLVSKIHGTKMMDGEKTTLQCTAHNCPQETQVKWIIRTKVGTTCEITEKESGDNEEEQPLMSMEYKVSSEKADSQKRKSLHDITSKLTFIPSVSRHLGSSVTCTFITDKKSEEKTHEIKDIYAKPLVQKPVQFSITSQGEVQMSTSLHRFYPRPLQISWTTKSGQSQEKIPSEEEDKENPDATYNLTSKCTVPGEIFKDPMCKVTVTWKHQSMDKSQSREISAKDLPWRPQIGGGIESVIRDDEILFSCLVSDYFPDALDVKWFEKKKDVPDLIEVSESEKYKIPEMVSHRTDKKTFSATPCLCVKKSLLTGTDVELIICRVDHPGLERVMEAKTSPAQHRDTDFQAFFVNNIHGPQTWYDGEKVTLYCAASYCTQDTRVVWIVMGGDGTSHEIREGVDTRKDKDGGRCPGYVAHRERTDMSDIPGLLDVTSCLIFTPSVSTHKSITIICRITSERRVKEKTFHPKQLYAKPKVLNPIKLSLTDSGEVLCALDIEEFYPSDIQINWNDKEKPSLDKTVINADGTYTVHSEYKLPGSFFRDPQAVVKISWKHEAMDGWERRQMSAVDEDFPWRPALQEIPVPNLLDGLTAALRCEVSNVFPDVLNVRWLKKEKDSPELFPLVHSDKYNISDITPERQKDNTFIYKACLRFTPSVTDQGAEFIFRAEHPSLGKPAEKTTGPLYIQDVRSLAPSQEKEQTESAPQTLQADSTSQEGIKDLATTIPRKDYQRLLVGDIRGRDRWTHGKKVTLQCPVSYCPEDVLVLWTVTDRDGNIQEVSSAADRPLKKREALKTSGYFLTTETDESDITGLCNITSIMSFIPIVTKHYGAEITCTVTSGGETRTRKFKPKSVQAEPQVPGPVEVSLSESGDVICALTLQNFYPKHITVKWTTEQNPLKSKEDLQENTDGTYNVCSRCTVQGSLFKDPNFKLSVTWSHKAMKEKGTRVLSWRDGANSFPWRPVIQEVPVPHVLMGQAITLQYNISGYFPDAVTVIWYKKEKGDLGSAPLHGNDKYKTSVTESQVQADATYSCTACLMFTPTLRDQGSEIICSVEHPGLERPLERSTGPLCVQGKPKSRKPVRLTLGKEEVKYSLILESFYPRDIQITWSCGSDVTRTFPSTEKYKSNMDKSHSVTSECRAPENDVKNPNFRMCVMWRHESMDDPGSREMSIRDKDYPFRPEMTIQTPHLYDNTEASLECVVYNCFPDTLHGMWLRKERSGETHPIPGDGAYRISYRELGRQPNNTFSYKSCLTFTPTVGSDQGAELIFQVEHPSLVHPMQKSTGALHIDDETPAYSQQLTGTPEQNHLTHQIQQTPILSPTKIEVMNEISNTQRTEEETTEMEPKSCLIFTPTVGSDQGAEFIFQEEHPSLVHPMQKSTGALHRDGEFPILDPDYYQQQTGTPELHHLTHQKQQTPIPSPTKIEIMNETSSLQSIEMEMDTIEPKSCQIFTPTVGSDPGTEFIFQVEHPSLVHPMQKSTGALQIDDSGNRDIDESYEMDCS